MTSSSGQMLQQFNFWMPWAISVVTIATMWMAGSQHRRAWLVGLVGQAMWLSWIVSSASWGLLPSNIVLWAVYFRNHLKWDRA